MGCHSCAAGVSEFASDNLYTWCTNCGNYGIFAAMKRALGHEQIHPHEAVLCFDIGCHGNGADKIGGYRVHGLHGRVLPLAAGVALANRRLKVIAFGGDGATLSEGLSHLVHSIRNNYNFVFILHNNANYGLTTGQASATSPQGVPMNSSPDGIVWDTLNAMDLVLSLRPSFAARTFSGDVHHMTGIFRSALQHQGFAFVEVLQTCTTYNHATPHEWYQERVYDLGASEDYDDTDLEQARKVAADLTEKVALGVIFRTTEKLEHYSRLANRKEIRSELVDEVRPHTITKLLEKLS